MPLELQAATLPPDTPLPATYQLLIDGIVQYIAINGADSLTGIVISEAQPGVDDQDKIWAQTDGDGNVRGLFFFLGTWNALPLLVPEVDTLPGTPTDGQILRYSARGSGLEMYRDGGFSSLLLPKLSTAERNALESVPTDFLVWDSTIKRVLRYEGTGWTTLEGILGEQRTFNGISVADALTNYPGWTEDTDMADRMFMGSSGTKGPDTQAGRESFAWRMKRRQINTASEDVVVGAMQIDGVTGTSPDVLNTSFGTAVDVPILNPYRAVVVLRKTLH